MSEILVALIGTAGLIVVAALPILVQSRRNGRKLDVQGTAVDQINHAVNHQPSTDPTLVMLVHSIHERVGDMHEAIGHPETGLEALNGKVADAADRAETAVQEAHNLRNVVTEAIERR